MRRLSSLHTRPTIAALDCGHITRDEWPVGLVIAARSSTPALHCWAGIGGHEVRPPSSRERAATVRQCVVSRTAALPLERNAGDAAAPA